MQCVTNITCMEAYILLQLAMKDAKPQALNRSLCGESGHYLALPCVFFVFLTDVFEKALNAGFIQATDYVEIWQAYLDYLRRRVDFSKGWSSRV